MPPRLQVPDYSFIGAAGRQLGRGIEAAGQAITARKEKKQEEIDFKKHWKEIELVYDGYKDAISETAGELGIPSEQVYRDIQSMTPPSLMKDDPKGFVKVMGKQYMDIINKYEQQGQEQKVGAAGREIVGGVTERPGIGEPHSGGEFGAAVEEGVPDLAELETEMGETPSEYRPGRKPPKTREEAMQIAATDYPEVSPQEIKPYLESLPTREGEFGRRLAEKREERLGVQAETANLKAKEAQRSAEVKQRRQQIKDKLARDKFYFDKELKLDKQKMATAKEIREIDNLIYEYGIDQEGFGEEALRAEDEYRDLQRQLKDAKEGGVAEDELDKIYSELYSKGKEVEGYKNRANKVIPDLIIKLEAQKQKLSKKGGTYRSGGGSTQVANPYSPEVLQRGAVLRRKGVPEEKVIAFMKRLQQEGG